jgi:hypothetical protein
MESEKKKRGRPPKKGRKDPWHLARALKILYAYDKARTSGMKHESAVIEAAAFVRQLNPEIPVSETEVKRILAELRPSSSPIAIKADYDVLEGEKAAGIRSHLNDLHDLEGSKVQLISPGEDPKRPLKRFSISLGMRQNYPRFNRKPTKE